MGARGTAEHFVGFLGELLKGAWGIAGGALSAVAILTYFVPQAATARPYLYIALVFSFVAAGFQISRKRDADVSSLTSQNQRLRDEIESLRAPRIDPETLAIVRTDYGKLQQFQRVSLRRLMATGEMTDQQMSRLLSEQGITQVQNPFGSIEALTSLVQRASARNARAEAIQGYRGNWRINPAMREALAEILKAES